MGPLRLAVAAAILAAPAPAAAGPIDRWASQIAEASARFGIPGAWIRRVMRAESAGMTRLHGRPIVSRKGAMGLMQLMPSTWEEMRLAHRLGSDPHDPRDNILAGAAYLRAMYERFGYPGLFAAYNAGPRRYREHAAGGRGLPRETLAYVASITSRSAHNAPEAGASPTILLFAVPPHGLSAGGDAAGDPAGGRPSIFVALGAAAPR